jgi:prevent-host-death family protein
LARRARLCLDAEEAGAQGEGGAGAALALRDPSALVRSLRRSGRPVFLTVNGRPRLVVQAAEAYERLTEQVERAATIEGLRKGLEAFERGEGVPAFEALEVMRKKHGLPRPR